MKKKNKSGTRGHTISEVTHCERKWMEESTTQAKAYILIYSREKIIQLNF
jgi:hypothetical protein